MAFTSDLSQSLAESEEDYTLLLAADRRLEENIGKPALSFQSVLDELGLSGADLEGTSTCQPSFRPLWAQKSNHPLR